MNTQVDDHDVLVAGRIKEARLHLTQKFVANWLTGKGYKVSESAVRSWENPQKEEEGSGAMPRPKMLLAFAQLTGRSSNWIMGEPGADPVHPRLIEACQALKTQVNQCEANDVLRRLLWCLDTAANMGFADWLTPMVLGNSLGFAAVTGDELAKRLSKEPEEKWHGLLEQMTARVPLPVDWLLTGNAATVKEWSASLPHRLVAQMLSQRIKPVAFMDNLHSHASEVRGWAK